MWGRSGARETDGKNRLEAAFRMENSRQQITAAQTLPMENPPVMSGEPGTSSSAVGSQGYLMEDYRAVARVGLMGTFFHMFSHRVRPHANLRALGSAVKIVGRDYQIATLNYCQACIEATS